MKLYRKTIALFAALLLVTGALGCADKGEGVPQDTSDEISGSEQCSPVVSEADEGHDGYWTEDVEISSLVTPYITLEYPEAWKNELVIEASEVEKSYVLDFCGASDLNGHCVFSVMFNGDVYGGYHLGYLDGVPVYVNVNENYDGLNDEQIAKVQSLQQHVNDIIIQIQYDEAFVR